MRECKPGVWENKTKQMKDERWIGDGLKTGDVDRRTPPEKGEEPTLAEVVTVPPLMRGFSSAPTPASGTTRRVRRRAIRMETVELVSGPGNKTAETYPHPG